MVASYSLEAAASVIPRELGGVAAGQLVPRLLTLQGSQVFERHQGAVA